MATTLAQIAFDRPRSRAYYTGIAIACIVIVVAGFSRRYYTQLAGPAPIALVVHLHAAAFAAWFAVVLAPLAIVLGALTAIQARGTVGIRAAPFAIRARSWRWASSTSHCLRDSSLQDFSIGTAATCTSA